MKIKLQLMCLKTSSPLFLASYVVRYVLFPVSPMGIEPFFLTASKNNSSGKFSKLLCIMDRISPTL